MKKFSKRSLAWLASLMLMISVLAGVIVLPAEAATVTYVKSGNYVYNWGQRDELATFLSPMAEAWYSKNNVTYAQLASLSGSSSQSSVPSSSLYLKLQDLMETNHTYVTGYKETNNLYRYTDCQNSAKNSSAISSFYSGTSIGPEWDSGATWNKEHTWPNSKGDASGDGENDIIMLRPTAKSENSSRGNTAYGESGDFYDPNKLGQNVHGDVARIMLYVYCRWGNTGSMWGASGVIESKAILLKWLEEDPVDTWELGRNDSVEAITGTRNVFVDYPELAFQLFGEDVPAGYNSPSGEGATAGYTVTASTNNSNYGTVLVKGNVITAVPETGYEPTGYTILSGTATVKQNGNVFTVSPSSDVSIRINFGKREEHTIQFVQAGGVTSTQTAYIGDAITLPAHSGSAPDGQTFIGWCEQEISETTEAPTYYAAGASWTVSAGVTLYALYARSEEGGVVNNNTFEQYSGDLTEGDYIIVHKGGALKAEVSSAKRFNYVEVSADSDSIQDPTADIVWHIAKNGSYWTLYNASVGAYAGGNGTENKGALLSSVTDYAKWTAAGSSTYEFVNLGNKNKSVNANLRRNGTYGYACYSTSTGGALTLYKRQSGTVYYSTAAKVVCDTHTYDNACDATCNVCGAIRTSADHVYTAQVTAATCGKDGVKTYTCSVCGDSYTEVIPATGAHTYDNACDADCNACGGQRTPEKHVYTAACATTCDVCGAVRTVTEGGETTITFDESKTHRIEFSSATQVWQNGDLIVTNNKSGATSNVADYSAPVRFYKGSQIIIAYPGMTTLIINAPTDEYGTPWKATLENAGLTCEVKGGVYTVTFNSPVDSITLTASAQIRANSITAIEAGAEHSYDNACDTACNACGDVREVGDHVYDNVNDTDCNECGAVRQIAAQVLSFAGSSISEDVSGLAFRFDANVSGAQTKNGNEYVTGSATVIPYVGGESYKVVRMGAIVSNGVSSVDVEAKYLWSWSADDASFAIRLINIPENQLDCEITARPYYVYEVDGEEVVIYGAPVSSTYNTAGK